MRKIISKRGALMQKYLIHLILTLFIIVLFFMVIYKKTDSRGVKQQILEKQLALFIESAYPGMQFVIPSSRVDYVINDIRINNGRIFVDVDSLVSVSGYPYFSRYRLSVRREGPNFLLEVYDE